MYQEFLKIVLWQGDDGGPVDREYSVSLVRKWRNQAIGLLCAQVGTHRVGVLGIHYGGSDYGVSLFGFMLGYDAAKREVWFAFPVELGDRYWHLPLPGHGDAE